MRKLIKKYLPALAACLAAVAVFTVCAVFGGERRTEALFRPYLRQFVLAGRPGATALPDPVRAIVLVCGGMDGAADSAYRFGFTETRALPEGIRAARPEEVNTVIRINKVYVRVRRSGGSDATALRAYVTVVNLLTDTYVVQNRMIYTAPPEEKDVWGRKKAVAEVGMEEVTELINAADPDFSGQLP